MAGGYLHTIRSGHWKDGLVSFGGGLIKKPLQRGVGVYLILEAPPEIKSNRDSIDTSSVFPSFIH
jgi:hypothetical protein